MWHDLALLMPELILTGMALVLILGARRIQRTPAAVIGTGLAALAAALASAWLLPSGHQSGFAGMITVDGYSQFFKVLISATLAVVALLSVRSLEEDLIPRAEYHILLLLASTGMMLAVSSHDLLPLYLSLELMTLCSQILVGIRVERPASNEAAIKYFLLGSFASALLIYGISLTYGVTGTTGFAGIASAISHNAGRNLLLVIAIGLVAAGLAFKVAAAPLHTWAPDAYQGASTPVAAFLASGPKAVGLAVFGRVCMGAYGSQAQLLSVILGTLAGLSIIIGSVVALSQTDMKRMLAYSSIAHAGYALLGLIAGTPAGASATMTYAVFYVFMTLGTFGVVVALGKRGEQLEGYRGLAAQSPGTAMLMLLFLMALTGIPPTAGFTAKFGVILSLVRSGNIALAVLAVACSVVSAFVYMRVVVLMYMNGPEDPLPSRLPAAVFAGLAVAALVTLIGGIAPGSLAPWAVSP
jgi:NADH-quinone oxidoreductase subunit N